MRLLPKSEIQKAKALDRQREIEEGKKLADKVDTLRELRSEEEVTLEAWRTKTVAAIAKEIADLTEVRDGLTHEVGHLEARRADALIPIDAEIAKLTALRIEVLDFKIDVDLRDTQLIQRQGELDNFERELAMDKERIKDMRITAKENVAHSVTIVAEANKVLAQAREQSEALMNGVNVREQMIEQREIRMASRERDVQLQAANNAKARKQNIADAIELADGQQTLERGFAELKQKQNGIRRNST